MDKREFIIARRNANNKRNLCLEENLNVDLNVCKRKCKMNCKQNFYYWQTTIRYVRNGDNRQHIFAIKARNTIVTEYTFNAKYSFAIFLANVGGLLSLWFGFCALDFNRVIVFVVKNCKNLILNYIDFEYILWKLSETQIFIRLYLFVLKTQKVIRLLDRYNWKQIIRILCIIYFIYQFYLLTYEYLQFKTQINVDLESIVDSDGHYLKSEYFPVISICKTDSELHFTAKCFIGINSTLSHCESLSPIRSVSISGNSLEIVM